MTLEETNFSRFLYDYISTKYPWQEQQSEKLHKDEQIDHCKWISMWLLLLIHRANNFINVCVLTHCENNTSSNYPKTQMFL